MIYVISGSRKCNWLFCVCYATECGISFLSTWFCQEEIFIGRVGRHWKHPWFVEKPWAAEHHHKKVSEFYSISNISFMMWCVLSNMVTEPFYFQQLSERHLPRGITQQHYLPLDTAEHTLPALGCIHIDTSVCSSTRSRVTVNMSLHVFWLFTLIQVLYKYGLAVNFTHQAVFVCVVFLSKPYK